MMRAQEEPTAVERVALQVGCRETAPCVWIARQTIWRADVRHLPAEDQRKPAKLQAQPANIRRRRAVSQVSRSAATR